MSADFDFAAHDDRLDNQESHRFPDWADSMEEGGYGVPCEERREREARCRALVAGWEERELLRVARAVGVVRP